MDDRERWDARYAEREPARLPPPAWLKAFDEVVPRDGRALDVAAGMGRAGLHAARLGLRSTLVDVSPVGLGLAAQVAVREGLQIDCRVSDLRRDPLPRGPWDLITCFAYEQPSLWPALCTALSEGGWLIAEIATQVNLERHARPPARFLIEPGAMRDRLRELEIIRLDEGWHDGRHTARVAARRSQARG